MKKDGRALSLAVLLASCDWNGDAPPMATATPARPMTVEDVLALPENGVERDLIRGELREWPMTLRNQWHSRVETRIARFLDEWLETQPQPRGCVVSGEAGFLLRRDPDTWVGVDVAYVPAELVARTPRTQAYFQGPPILAVEILSPSDTQEHVDQKVAAYLEAGVAVVWVIHPTLRTVLVHRPGAEPELYNATHELTAEPHLPGFRVPVARLFG
jgi:Uma2 family endonuclease